MDSLENQFQWSNFIIDGVPEGKKVKTGENVRNWSFKRTLKIDHAHRVRKPRQIVVKLLYYKDKQKILSQTKKLKGTQIYINEDFSDLITKKKKKLLPQQRAHPPGEGSFCRVQVWQVSYQTKKKLSYVYLTIRNNDILFFKWHIWTSVA